jgi:Immunity protein 8
VQAVVKSVHSPDTEDIFSFRPNGPFCVLVQFKIGPKDGQGEESFDVIVCSPSWLEEQSAEVISGRDKLIMKEFNPSIFTDYINRQITALHGGSWHEIAAQIDRIGKWEFRDYSFAKSP